MSDEERDVILQMLADDKISTAEAASLLDALKEAGADEQSSESPWWSGEQEGAARDRGFGDREARRHERDMRRREKEMERHARQREREGRRAFPSGRSLQIHISDGDDTRTHVHIPLGMAAAAGKFIPRKARTYFEEYGIDLTDLLDSVMSDITRAGEIVNIQDGDRRVHVSVVGSDSEPMQAPQAPDAPAHPAPPAPVPPVPPSSPTSEI